MIDAGTRLLDGVQTHHRLLWQPRLWQVRSGLVEWLKEGGRDRCNPRLLREGGREGGKEGEKYTCILIDVYRCFDMNGVCTAPCFYFRSASRNQALHRILWCFFYNPSSRPEERVRLLGEQPLASRVFRLLPCVVVGGRMPRCRRNLAPRVRRELVGEPSSDARDLFPRFSCFAHVHEKSPLTPSLPPFLPRSRMWTCFLVFPGRCR